MQERVLFRRIHGQVILTRAARIDEFQNYVFADAFQVPPPPGFPRISARRAAALFHRPVVRAARGVRFLFIFRFASLSNFWGAGGVPGSCAAEIAGMPIAIKKMAINRVRTTLDMKTPQTLGQFDSNPSLAPRQSKESLHFLTLVPRRRLDHGKAGLVA